MKLFQYWDTGDPPDDVAACIESFRALNPDMEHRLFSRDDAAWFIKKRFGQRELKAFEACAVPAMQADYFRLCAIVAKGGVYADADHRCVAPLGRLIKKHARPSLLLVFNGRITNSFIVAREAANPFFSACLSVASENIEERCFDDPFVATGPGIMQALWAMICPEAANPSDPLGHTWEPTELVPFVGLHAGREEVQSAFRKMSLLHLFSVADWLVDGEPAYKTSDTHWSRWKGSLFLDQQTPPVTA